MADADITILDKDGVARKIDTRTVGAGLDEHREVSVIGDGVSTLTAGMRADGYLNVRQDPTSLLQDTFESVDTANTWTLGGLTVPTGTGGVLTVNPGTAANGSSWAKSQASFLNASSAFLQNVFIVSVETGVVTGNTRWWGLGIPQTTPTTTVPMLNGVVFEIRAADGLLYGSAYSNGVVSQSVALTRPTDGANHRYQILHRSSRTYFSIDGVESGSIAFPAPAVSALPTTLGSVNGGTALGAAPVLTCTLVGVGDTGRNAAALSDPKYPWREARVTSGGELLTTDSYRLKQAVAIAHTGKSTVTAAADAATAGRFWLINPVGSTILIEVRRVEFSSAPIAATAFVTSPRVTVERVTFTGTASGAQITPAKRDSTEVAFVGTLRTASTGLTLTAGAACYGFTVVPILTAVGSAVPSLQEWEPNEAGRIVLRAGEGIVVRQADAGTTADTRAFAVNLAWAEYTNPL